MIGGGERKKEGGGGGGRCISRENEIPRGDES